MAASASPSLGDRIADVVTAFSGSWRFLGLHLIWWTLWIFILHIETFPFGLLTMLLSLEAIILATLVLMSQGRAADRDRVMMQQQAREVTEIDDLEHQDRDILREVHRLMRLQNIHMGIVPTADEPSPDAGVNNTERP